MTNPYREPAEQPEEVFCHRCRHHYSYSSNWCCHPNRPTVKTCLAIEQPYLICEVQNKNNQCSLFEAPLPRAKWKPNITIQRFVGIALIVTSIIGFLWLLYSNL